LSAAGDRATIAPRMDAGAGRGTVLVLAAALLWSMGGLGIKAVPEPPLTVACYRSGIAAVVLLALLRPRRWRWTPAFVAAVASYAACVTTFVVATKWTSAANAIFLQYSGVVWVLLASPLVLGEPLRGRDALAVAVAFAGMALFFVGELEPRGRAGDLVALGSGMAFAALVLSLRRERDLGAEAAVAFGNLLVAVVLLPAATGAGLPPPRSLAVLAVLGVFQIAAAYALFVRGLRTVPATRAALVGMLEPVANPVWVFLALGERPRASSLLGGGVVLAAIAWHALARPRPVTRRTRARRTVDGAG
jgi:drug/metabolite transporter (DMT)-like permease